jgi:ubiquinone/menaquinone biosynthesis C-methylase UbiE
MKQNQPYHPEPYWSDVAKRINAREEENVIAGDDEPYYRYKRIKFLKLLNSLHFTSKSVLELGCGPGGNLSELCLSKPARLVGVDISRDMIELAQKNVRCEGVELIKIDGQGLPFEDKTFDLCFTATVLQHNTDQQMMETILRDLCRVSKEYVVLFEHIDQNGVSGDELMRGRPVKLYADICKACGFELVEQEFINIKISYFVCGAIRKLLNPKTRQEGEPLTKFSVLMQNLTLLVTKPLDNVFKSESDLGKLVFKRVE